MERSNRHRPLKILLFHQTTKMTRPFRLLRRASQLVLVMTPSTQIAHQKLQKRLTRRSFWWRRL
ncbi:hypothetical protein BDP81DRAFT_420339 [Colletotrichum phormii]|uniref:Uncharacterized protein n=1 Tax=Colletotrichum phormii TaxID=359342 RepID=A0AAI9ZZ81_9PEZI|nr:uncharacterized protein BDP81DRAFT_420339 [Colletotrichum phormii]KAK1640581.1 hypothetical protein BDP81DRAFT_420339 [Colletotrichum phormii]